MKFVPALIVLLALLLACNEEERPAAHVPKPEPLVSSPSTVLDDACLPRRPVSYGGQFDLEQARQTCLLRRDVRALADALRAISDRPVSIADRP
mgnify:CR=1 FL=1